nr:SRPK-D [Diplonema papillatum]
MVCTWTANGQEDQSRYGENGYMRIKKGMVLDHRYHVISKLGWGEFATVWLAWDQESLRKRLTSCTSQFVAIKVSKCAEHVGNAAKEEANLLKYIGKNGRGSGMASLATVLDVFNQKGDYGNHVCMVFPVLGQNILCLVEQAHRHRSMSRGLPSLTATAKRPAEDVSFVKSCLRASLRACNELSRLNIVHTDLKPENILLTTVSQKTRETMREWQDAVAKLRGTPWEPERLVPTNEHSIDVEKEHSYIRVSDFGLSSLLDPEAKAHGIGTHARRLQTKRKGYATNPLGVILQTREYRAPEVLFGNPITPTADVWSIGCMAYELVTGTFLMDPKKDPKKRTKPEDEINMDHICMMQQIIGPVPAHVAKMGGKHLPKYFTDDGRFYQQEKADKYFPPRNLKHELCVFLTDNDSDMLCNFVNQCLGSFDTTARATAEEMLKHPFLSR